MTKQGWIRIFWTRKRGWIPEKKGIQSVLSPFCPDLHVINVTTFSNIMGYPISRNHPGSAGELQSNTMYYLIVRQKYLHVHRHFVISWNYGEIKHFTDNEECQCWGQAYICHVCFCQHDAWPLFIAKTEFSVGWSIGTTRSIPIKYKKNIKCIC